MQTTQAESKTQTESQSQLPTPTKRRWQPIRSGLINFYKYDDQTFYFHEGRLLLKGNNGTGKSRVLALQLPFLLDGELGAERVEPDGDPAKKFEWNLLMGKHEDRTGYTWIEFGRVDENGTQQFLTLGCGVRAVKGRGVVSKWFFVTQQRVRQDIQLCSMYGEPFGKEALSELVQEQGQGAVYTTAMEYREAVNKALFGLTQGRYEALVKLLISLRQPQLARQLDEQRLSSSLSDSLTPVPAKVISQVADAMRGLDEDRQALEGLIAAKNSADGFLTEYRKYAQALAGRRSRELINAQNAYENKGRLLRQAESLLSEAKQKQTELEAELVELTLKLTEDDERRKTLEASPEMKSARDIQKAQEDAGFRKRDVEAAANRHTRAQSEYAVEAQKDKQAQQRLQNTVDELIAKEKNTKLAATACGLTEPYEQVLADGLLTKAQDKRQVDKAASIMDAAVKDRRRAGKVVAELNLALTQARSKLEKLSNFRDQEQERLDSAEVEAVKAGNAVQEAGHKLSDAYKAWLQTLSVLKPAAAHEVTPEIAAWIEEQVQASGPVSLAVQDAARVHADQSARLRAEHNQTRRGFVFEREKWLAEHARLKAGVHLPPPAPYTRGEGARTDRPGAPLWMLCDFREGISDQEKAGLEAGLESAGLLDAWVNPDGSILKSDAGYDTLLVVSEGDTGQVLSSESLLKVMQPIGEQSQVGTDVIERILHAIGLGESEQKTWVDVSGRWRLGPVRGHWEKPAAQHIGQVAREAARVKRLAELEMLVAELEAKIAAVDASLGALALEEQSARKEAASAPGEGEVRTNVARLGALMEERMRAQTRVMEARKNVADAERLVDEHKARRDESAADLKLTAWVEKLADYSDLIGAMERQLAGLWPMAAARIVAANAAFDQAGRLADAKSRVAETDEALGSANHRLAGALAHLDTLKETMGAAVQEVQQKLSQVIERLSTFAKSKETKNQELGGTRAQVDRYEQAILTHTLEVREETQKRAEVIARFNQFAQTGLLALATEEDKTIAERFTVELSVTAVVDLGRLAAQALGEAGIDGDAWSKMQQRIHEHVEGLKAALQSHEYRPEPSLENEIWVVRVAFRGVRIGVETFARQIAEEIVNRQAVLTASERHVLEEYLIKDIAVVLTELISDANTLVNNMNKQLASRPTSRGMTLRFKWDASAESPASYAEARRRLLGTSMVWSEKDRQVVGAFLQEQIRRMREMPGTWQEQLTAAFDYRQWHSFHVERKLDGDWERLTKRLHGTGSGGEKALALTIPQFAAAAAYYGSEGAIAPRLILLDEAFVGIDSDMRAKCMGMLSEFDLDFVMTSEREWGCYSTLPGLAIYQLSARAGIDAVWATRWVWNGRERVMSDPDKKATPTASGLFASPEAAGGPAIDNKINLGAAE